MNQAWLGKANVMIQRVGFILKKIEFVLQTVTAFCLKKIFCLWMHFCSPIFIRKYIVHN